MDFWLVLLDLVVDFFFNYYFKVLRVFKNKCEVVLFWGWIAFVCFCFCILMVLVLGV